MKHIRLTTKTALCWLGMSVMVFSYVEDQDFLSFDLGYENTIVAIDEFATSSGSKILLRFEHDDPICTYTPQSFSESVGNRVYRFSMPRTKLGYGISTSCDIQEDQDTVELVLHGSSCNKITSGNTVLLVVHREKE